MNENQPTPNIPTAASVLLIASTALFGWLYLSNYPKGDTPQPPESKATLSVPASEQNITARLWEDPLQAVQAESGKGREQTDTLTNLARTVQMNLAEEQSNRACLLVVPIPGTTFPDDNETRLRLRYSIQMAFAQKQYSPKDRDHLGYFQFNWPGGDSWHPSLMNRSEFMQFSNTVAVPYEWFASRSTTDQVLVVWLPDQYLNKEPLCSLAYLRSTLCLALSAKQMQRFLGPFVVGPRSSDTLKSIAMQCGEQDQAQTHVCKRILETNLCIHSPQATAPDALIGLRATDLWSQTRTDLRDKLDTWFSGTNCCGSSNSWCYLRNYIATDDQLTDLIAMELNYRLPKFNTKRDRILVLAEADTSYGQSLPLALQESVRNYLINPTNLSFLRTQPVSSPTATRLRPSSTSTEGGLIVVRYLRGLDQAKGRTGGESLERTTGAPKSSEEALAAALTQKASPAQGESQLDYAQRLVAKVKADLSSKHAKAVGILGGDIYDKLILLQAVRSKFKEAVFFTTDLDARLWDPAHLSYTRNLIVASSSDVLLPAYKTNFFEIPPFRDVYQVAVFNACCDALEQVWKGNLLSAVAQQEAGPSIFELGRHGPVKLQVQESHSKAGLVWTLVLQVGVLVFGLLGIFFAGLIWSKLHQASFSSVSDKTLAWVGPTVVCAVVIVYLFCCLASTSLSQRPGGEPFLLAEGVSVWPTEAVRLLTFFCILWMLALLLVREKTHQEKLRNRFLGRFPDKASTPARSTQAADQTPAIQDSFPKIKKAYLRQIFSYLTAALNYPFPRWPDTEEIKAKASVNPRDVFDIYRDATQFRVRLMRVSLGALVYLVVVVGIFLINGLPLRTNVRGFLARDLDIVLLGLSVSTFLFLVFYVLDSVWQTTRLLSCFSTSWPSMWSEETEAAQEVANDFHLPAGKLNGLKWYLDVRFAVETTKETAKLIFLPFIVQFLMLLSRNSYFDNWTWPPALVFVLVCNIMLAGAAWGLLRWAAQKLRSSALEQLRSLLFNVRLQLASTSVATTLGTEKLALKEMIKRIEQEKGGAYSRIIQDPALLAVMLPTGALGILSIFVQAFLGKL